MTATTCTRLGGPFLDSLPYSPGSSSSSSSTSSHRRPLLTPPIATSNSDDDEGRQYLLLPGRSTVDVVSMETGRAVTRLTVAGEDGGSDGSGGGGVEIHTVCIAQVAVESSDGGGAPGGASMDDGSSSSDDNEDSDEASAAKDVSAEELRSSPSSEYIILAGCSDNTVREWSLRDAVLGAAGRVRQTSKRKSSGGGNGRGTSAYHPLNGTEPRRILTVAVEPSDRNKPVERGGGKSNTKRGVTLLASLPVPPLKDDEESSVADHYGTVYALISSDGKEANLVRLSIPSFGKTTSSSGSGRDGVVQMSLSAEELGIFGLKTKKGGGGSKQSPKKQSKSKGKEQEEEVARRKQVVSVRSLPFDLIVSSPPWRASEDPKTPTKKEVAVLAMTRSGLAVCTDVRSGEANIVPEDEASSSHPSPSSSSSVIVYYPKTRHETAIASACVAPNGADVAVGYGDGLIEVQVGLVEAARAFLAGRSSHPSAGVVVRSLRWHTHAVSALTFLGAAAAGGGGAGDGNLLSGGEESVLLTWSLDRGISKPIHTLPRLAKGGIVHLIPNVYVPSKVEIAVYCTDNTLRLINGYNHSTKWRVQGLADAPVDPKKSGLVVTPAPACPGTILLHDPRTRLPILSNLSGAPGSVHWYDPSSQRVVGTLEVAPYNRISRKEATDAAVPAPQVTHLCLSESGDDMITIDTILTENSGMGGRRRVASKDGSGAKEDMSLFTTIKFWSWSKGGAVGGSSKGKLVAGRLDMPYQLISAMPSPHGLTGGEVSSLAITADGSKACTLSHEEGAFRVWAKGRGYVEEGASSTDPPAPLWKCLYKITTPSGFSRAMPKSPTAPGHQVAFSADGSVLAVCYGEHVTLWDHANSALLTSVKCTESIIDVAFTKTGTDSLLLRGKSSVAVQAPFGNNNRAYLGGSWSYGLTSQGDLAKLKGKVEVSHAVSIPSRKELAVALVEKSTKQTSIVILDENTGDPKTTDDDRSLCWQIPGTLRALCEVSRQDAAGEGTARLVALTDRHELLALECIEENLDEAAALDGRPAYDVRNKVEAFRKGNSTTGAPTLLVGNSSSGGGNKRRKKNLGLTFESNRNDVISRFGSDSGDPSASKSAPLASAELPALSGIFARDFIGSALRR